MAVGFSASIVNTFLDGLDDDWIQLHVGDPGAAGTANPAGNTTRKPVSWAAASGGSKDNDTAITWTTGEVVSSEDYTHASLWSESVGGTFASSGVTTANAVTAGDEFEIAIGQIVKSIDDIAA